jgi:hypothetical protein
MTEASKYPKEQSAATDSMMDQVKTKIRNKRALHPAASKTDTESVAGIKSLGITVASGSWPERCGDSYVVLDLLRIVGENRGRATCDMCDMHLI